MSEANNKKIFLYHFKKAALKQESNIKNPVRKGYVLRPEHCKYTTARNWLNGADEVNSIDLEHLLI